MEVATGHLRARSVFLGEAQGKWISWLVGWVGLVFLVGELPGWLGCLVGLLGCFVWLGLVAWLGWLVG